MAGPGTGPSGPAVEKHWLKFTAVFPNENFLNMLKYIMIH
jgi:hypothetical protein